MKHNLRDIANYQQNVIIIIIIILVIIIVIILAIIIIITQSLGQIFSFSWVIVVAYREILRNDSFIIYLLLIIIIIIYIY